MFCNNSDVILLIFSGTDQVVVDNGICEVTLSKPEGDVTAVSYNGMENLLEILNEDYNRGFVICSLYLAIIFSILRLFLLLCLQKNLRIWNMFM